LAATGAGAAQDAECRLQLERLIEMAEMTP
jgi:hypothetical protein